MMYNGSFPQPECQCRAPPTAIHNVRFFVQLCTLNILIFEGDILWLQRIKPPVSMLKK